jgi:hypothetical protein
MFEATTVEVPEMNCAEVWQSSPLIYSSLGQHQHENPYCVDLRDKLRTSTGSVDSFQIGRDSCFNPKRAKRRMWVIPASLRPMLLNYCHDSVMSGHLGAPKKFLKIATNFWWLRMRSEIFDYVRKCDLCQRAKSMQDA